MPSMVNTVVSDSMVEENSADNGFCTVANG